MTGMRKRAKANELPLEDVEPQIDSDFSSRTGQVG